MESMETQVIEKDFLPRQMYLPEFIREHALLAGHLALFAGLGLAAILCPDQAGAAVDAFENWTAANPWLSSAVKFGLLGTYGDLLGRRLGTGHWNLSLENLSYPIYWSAAGLVIKGAFTVYFGGMDILAGKLLPVLNTPIFGLPIIKAVVTSALLNFTFYPVLVKAHACYDQHVAALIKGQSFKNFLLEPLKLGKDLATFQFMMIDRDWFPLARKLWWPAHILTPLLPVARQIEYAVLLSFLLAVDFGRRAAKTRQCQQH